MLANAQIDRKHPRCNRSTHHNPNRAEFDTDPTILATLSLLPNMLDDTQASDPPVEEQKDVSNEAEKGDEAFLDALDSEIEHYSATVRTSLTRS